MISACSASIARRSPNGGNGRPNFRCSVSCQPVPSPSSTRPPDRPSATSASFASTTGGRNVTGETMVPSWIRFVTAASAHSTPHTSSEARPSAPTTEK